MIHRYTLVGNPIAHSISPDIHGWFSEQTQREIVYTKTQCTEETLDETIRAFVKSGGAGLNVTVPFKQSVLPLCDRLSPEAGLANAVNTIKVEGDGSLSGHNTDGSGLLVDLTRNNQIELKQSRILIAGAGGSVSGFLGPLLSAQPEKVVIANRTLSKAEELSTRFAKIGRVEACSFENINECFDLIINATSLSLQNEKPPLDDNTINNSTVVYDLMYGRDTPFMDWARNCGAKLVLDGTGMLLEQAADAFFIWEDVRPKTRLILPRLKA